MILTDAGPLIALLDRGEEHHQACVACLAQLTGPMLTTWPAFTEAMYLLHGIGGWPLQRQLWEHVVRGTLRFHFPDEAEGKRMMELMEKYRDRPMDLADASLVTAAETLKTTSIFTLDGDFYIYRLYGKQAFAVVP